jgi:hypothetical protein
VWLNADQRPLWWQFFQQPRHIEQIGQADFVDAAAAPRSFSSISMSVKVCTRQNRVLPKGLAGFSSISMSVKVCTAPGG